MNKFIGIAIVAAFGITASMAHEPGEHASTEGIFGLKAEYVHVLINPLPVYGLALGAVSLLAAWFARSRKAEVIALLLIVFSSAMAWPVLHFGQNGYNHLYRQLDTESQQWLDTHMHRAEQSIYIFYATAVMGIATLGCFRKFPKTARITSVVTLAASLISAGIGGWISRAGGEASHSEFRSESAPATESAPHEHGAPGQSHDTMQHDKQPSGPTNDHKVEHEGMTKETTPKTLLPGTLEGTWKAIHEHHTQLQSAISARNFTLARSHAQSLSELSKRLVELSASDKSAVEGGVNKVIQTLTQLNESAETGSDLVMKNESDALGKTLNELEAQMKKQ